MPPSLDDEFHTCHALHDPDASKLRERLGEEPKSSDSRPKGEDHPALKGFMMLYGLVAPIFQEIPATILHGILHGHRWEAALATTLENCNNTPTLRLV